MLTEIVETAWYAYLYLLPSFSPLNRAAYYIFILILAQVLRRIFKALLFKC